MQDSEAEKDSSRLKSSEVRAIEADDCVKTVAPSLEQRPSNGKKLYALKERRLQEFYREQRLNGEAKKEIKEESESECSSDLSQEDKNNNNVGNGARRCGECGLLLGSKQALIEHGLAEHEKQSERSEPSSTKTQNCDFSERSYSCKECGLEFSSDDSLSLHVIASHPVSDNAECVTDTSATAVRCEDCGLDFSCSEALAAHGKSAHGKPYTCTRCSKQFVHRGHWAAHQRLHVEPKQQHPCSHCPKVFLTRASLKVKFLKQ